MKLPVGETKMTSETARPMELLAVQWYRPSWTFLGSVNSILSGEGKVMPSRSSSIFTWFLNQVIWASGTALTLHSKWNLKLIISLRICDNVFLNELTFESNFDFCLINQLVFLYKYLQLLKYSKYDLKFKSHKWKLDS